MTDHRPRLLLIDGHSMAFRAFFALPAENFRTSGGLYTNAVHGFLSMLLNLIANEKPTHLAVAFDTHAPTFRKQEYDAYKDGREDTPSEFLGQVNHIEQVLRAMRVTVVAKDGFEADDLLATLATTAQQAGAEVQVVSGDRDTFQLVNEDVTVLYPVKGVSDLRRMTPEAVEEKYGVPPALHPDLTALVGEKSDNLPGVPGVGPKTAAKWITTYANLDGIVAHADEIKGKAGENLRAHLDDVLRNRRLNHLLTDTEIPGLSALGEPQAQLEALTMGPVEREEANALFDVLEMTTVRKRLFETLPSDGPQEDAPSIELQAYTSATVPGGVAAWLAGLPSEQLTGVLVTGVSTPGRGDAETIAIGSGTGEGLWLEFSALTPQDEEALSSWLADETQRKALHEAKNAWHALHGRGITLAGVAVDTEIAAYLHLPDQRRYDLDDLLQRFVGRALTPGQAASGQLDLDLPAEGEVSTSARALIERADALPALAEAFAQELDERDQTSLLDELEMPVQRVLAQMEDVGIGADEAHLENLEADFGAIVARAQENAYGVLRAAGIDHEVNLSSPKQLQGVLFDELDMPKTKRTKTGYTTDADALQELFRKTEHPFLAFLLEHRDAIKLRQTVETLRRFIQPDGHIHTSFKQTVAATGRLASADPNLQNIPQRTVAGRRIRQSFRPGAGFDALMTADYSQIEMRIMAHLSKDEGLIESFRTGEDLHRFVASRVFGIPLDEVSAADRSRVKAISYGLAYGLSAYGLSRQLQIGVDEAQKLMDDYFARFGGVRDYLHNVVQQATKDGYTSTIMGRRRYLPDLTSDNRQRRENAKRVALNAPIQGSAADIIKVAMVRLEEMLREAGVRSRLLLQVHDELVLEIVAAEREQVEQMVRDAMSSAATLEVPLDVSVGVGATWFDAAH